MGTPGGPTQYEGRPVGSVIRIWPDASLDTTFQSTVYWGPVMRKKYFYPDGRFLMFGCFQTPEYPGDTIAILRLHPDGSTDTTWPHIPFRYFGFFPGLGQVRDFVEFEPGKLLVVGEFTYIGTREVGGIAVIDTAGNVLENYFTGTGAGWLPTTNQGTLRSILGVEQGPDGSIYIFGSYSGFDDGYGNHANQRMITRLYPVNVGVGEISGSAPALRVWPNPGDGLLNVHWPGHTKAMLEVRDALGRMMHGGTYVGGSWQVDLSHLPSGLYTLLLSTPEGERATTKWIKQ